MNIKKFLVLLCLIVVAFAAGFFFFQNKKIPLETKCLPKLKKIDIRDKNMEPLLFTGHSATFDENYYICHTAKNNDLVAYRYSQDKPLVPRILKGMPGDEIELRPDSKTTSTWNIVINGQILKNSFGQEYLLKQSRYKILNTYVRDYNGVIPSNAYLIMNNSQTENDSASTGLIGAKDIAGKITK